MTCCWIVITHDAHIYFTCMLPPLDNTIHNQFLWKFCVQGMLLAATIQLRIHVFSNKPEYVLCSNWYNSICLLPYLLLRWSFFNWRIIYFSRNFINCGYFFNTFLDSVIQSILTTYSKVHDSVSWRNWYVLLNE